MRTQAEIDRLMNEAARLVEVGVRGTGQRDPCKLLHVVAHRSCPQFSEMLEAAGRTFGRDWVLLISRRDKFAIDPRSSASEMRADDLAIVAMVEDQVRAIGLPWRGGVAFGSPGGCA